jgi:sugar phosphate isomerase/epimerase
MKVGLCTIAFNKTPLPDVLDMAAEVGFDGVEIWGNDPHFGAPYTKERAAEIRSEADKRGLKVSVLGSYLRLGKGERELAALPALIAAAQILETKIIRVWAHQKGSAQATPEEWAACVRDARRACEMALPSGIILALEMHDNTFADRGDTTARLIAECGLPNLKANYQAAFSPGADEPIERLNKVINHVVNVHAQNFEAPIGAVKSLKRAHLATGVINYRAIVERLRGAGYDGYIEAEFVSEPAREWLEADCHFLRSLCA